MTYETFITVVAILGATPLVLCILYLMQTNIIIGEETLVYKAVCIVWGLLVLPFVIATGWITGVFLMYWGLVLGQYLTLVLMYS